MSIKKWILVVLGFLLMFGGAGLFIGSLVQIFNSGVTYRYSLGTGGFDKDDFFLFSMMAEVIVAIAGLILLGRSGIISEKNIKAPRTTKKFLP